MGMINDLTQLPEAQQVEENDLLMVGTTENGNDVIRKATIKKIFELIRGISDDELAELNRLIEGKADNTVMQGATSEQAGVSGLVPAPQAGQQDKYLKGDGSFSDVVAVNSAKLEGKSIDNIFRDRHCLHRNVTGLSVGWHLLVRLNNGNPKNSFIYRVFTSGYSGGGFKSLDLVVSDIYDTYEYRPALLTTNNYHDGSFSKIRKVVRNGKVEYHIYTAKSLDVGMTFAFEGHSSITEDSVLLESISDDAYDELIYEYNIPRYPDVGFNKSLTNFTEIPAGADMNSPTYHVPGCYACNSDANAKTLLNCPMSGAFTLNVSFSTGSGTYVSQMFEGYQNDKIVKRMRNKGDSTVKWKEHTYYPLPTPTPNKVLCTNSSGQLAWLDTPPQQ